MLNPVGLNSSAQEQDYQSSSKKKPASSALDDLADLEDLMEGGSVEGNVQQFL